MGVWWLPVISTTLGITVYVFIRRAGFDTSNIKLPSSSRLTTVLDWIIPRIEPIFRLEWFYRLALIGINFFSRILGGFSIILEGEGGILWTILLLVLLISLLASIGG
jgi:hypothetical protein